MHVIREYVVNSEKVLFEGDGYSDEWHHEAERRGLANVRTTPLALDAMVTEKAKHLYESNGVYTHIELEARHEIELEKYIKRVQIEARIMGELATSHVLPPAIKYQNILIQNIKGLKELGLKESAYSNQQLILEQISEHIGKVSELRSKDDRSPENSQCYDRHPHQGYRLQQPGEGTLLRPDPLPRRQARAAYRRQGMGSFKVPRNPLPALINTLNTKARESKQIRGPFFISIAASLAVLVHPFLNPFLCDLQLLRHRQMRIIQHNRIIRLPQRANLPVRIDIIPHRQVVLYLFQRHIGIFLIKLSETSLNPYLFICRHKDLQLGIRKDHCTDIPAIHYDSLPAPHLLLFGHRKRSYGLYSRYFADLLGDNQVPDHILHVFAVKIHLRLPILVIGHKLQADDIQRLIHGCSIGPVDVISEEIQRDSPVHRTAVDIDVMQLPGQLFCQCTLSTGRPAINGDYYFFLLFHFTTNVQKKKAAAN